MNTLKKFNQKFKKEIKMVLTTQGAKYSEELKNKVKGFVLAHHESDGKKGFSPATISELTGINRDLIYRWRYQVLNPDGSGYGQKKKVKVNVNVKVKKAKDLAAPVLNKIPPVKDWRLYSVKNQGKLGEQVLGGLNSTLSVHSGELSLVDPGLFATEAGLLTAVG